MLLLVVGKKLELVVKAEAVASTRVKGRSICLIINSLAGPGQNCVCVYLLLSVADAKGKKNQGGCCLPVRV